MDVLRPTPSLSGHLKESIAPQRRDACYLSMGSHRCVSSLEEDAFTMSVLGDAVIRC